MDPFNCKKWNFQTKYKKSPYSNGIRPSQPNYDKSWWRTVTSNLKTKIYYCCYIREKKRKLHIKSVNFAHRHTDRVPTVDTLSGFQDFFLQWSVQYIVNMHFYNLILTLFWLLYPLICEPLAFSLSSVQFQYFTNMNGCLFFVLADN